MYIKLKKNPKQKLCADLIKTKIRESLELIRNQFVGVVF